MPSMQFFRRFNRGFRVLPGDQFEARASAAGKSSKTDPPRPAVWSRWLVLSQAAAGLLLSFLCALDISGSAATFTLSQRLGQLRLVFS